MKASIVIGLGYGDEGKGSQVADLCYKSLQTKNEKPLVIRFGGGHQCGHTVGIIKDEKEIFHSFGNFGSGTLHGVPTYLSEEVIIYPVSALREEKILYQKMGAGFKPELYVSASCRVCTHYDLAWNRIDKENLKHGSVGVGINATVERHKVIPLFARDLLHTDVLNIKLTLIQQYYERKMQGNSNLPIYENPRFDEFYKHVSDTLGTDGNDDCDYEFVEQAVEYTQNYKIVEDNYVSYVLLDYKHHLIFEGNQGIMLDQDFGFAPHTTPSYCTSRNVVSVLERFNIMPEDPITTYYMTRSYGTRHGNGPMVTEDVVVSNIAASKVPSVPYESNVDNKYQGDFFVTDLNIHQILYALSCDVKYQTEGAERYVIMTCFDQFNPFPMLNTINNRGIGNPRELEEEINEELFGIHRMPKFWIKDVITKSTPFTNF